MHVMKDSDVESVFYSFMIPVLSREKQYDIAENNIRNIRCAGIDAFVRKGELFDAEIIY